MQNKLCELPSHSIIVMDNAAFHRKKRLICIAETHGHRIIFLPPYSPEHNPIAKFWTWLKFKLHRALVFFISFDKNGKTFRIGEKLGNTSLFQILAPELTDRILADFLNLEHSQLINFHVQSIDQVEAIKLVKERLSDIDKMKIDLQKKANQTGYDMDVLPADLKTYGQEAESLLNDLQSHNERMF